MTQLSNGDTRSTTHGSRCRCCAILMTFDADKIAMYGLALAEKTLYLRVVNSNIPSSKQLWIEQLSMHQTSNMVMDWPEYVLSCSVCSTRPQAWFSLGLTAWPSDTSAPCKDPKHTCVQIS